MSIFAKRHYEVIATVMQQCYSEEDPDNTIWWWKLAQTLANAFKDDNERFDVDRWIAACQPGANVRVRARK